MHKRATLNRALRFNRPETYIHIHEKPWVWDSHLLQRKSTRDAGTGTNNKETGTPFPNLIKPLNRHDDGRVAYYYYDQEW